jgi:hypothetical protein
MLFIFSAKSNLQHWGKPSGSTPIFYEKISRLVVIYYIKTVFLYFKNKSDEKDYLFIIHFFSKLQMFCSVKNKAR